MSEAAVKANEDLPRTTKSKATKTVPKAVDAVPEIITKGPDVWKLISATYCSSDQWAKTTMAMEVPRVGVVLRVSARQRNQDGSYALTESTSFIPGVKVHEEQVGKEVHRKLIHNTY